MYEVILYAAIATIICVMLYTVLGKSVGQGPESGFDAEKAIKNLQNKDNKVVQLNTPSATPRSKSRLFYDPRSLCCWR